VRRLLTAVGLSVLICEGAQAQAAWKPEIGIQGGYARIKPAGTGRNDAIDDFGIPGAGYVLGLLTYGNLYAIIPWSNKLAVEPSIAASQLGTNSTGGFATTVRVGVRANYAFTPKVYGAAGLEMLNLAAGTQRLSSFGVQAALGYRFRLTNTINGRLEAHVAAIQKDKNLTPTDVYALLFGISSRVGGPAPAPARGARTTRAWQPALGVQGGYFSAHTVGSGAGTDIAGISFPGIGGSISVLSSHVALPPTLFVILPMGTKTAIEPGVDIHRVQTPGGPSTGFSGNFSARLDYAVAGGWYAAGGGSLNYLKYSGIDAASVLGANVAWGYRFHFSGGWGGRIEANYSMFGKHDNNGSATKLKVAPQNTFGIQFGASMPLK
jgi:hypothetical protein